VSVRHIGSAAEVSGHFGSIPLLPKCPTAEVSCCRSVRTPIVIGPVCVCVFATGGREGGVCYHDNSKLCASIFTKLGM